MKRYERCIAVLIVVMLLAAVIVQRPSVVSGLDTKAPESVVAAWSNSQETAGSDEAKIRATVDAFFQLDYANRTTTTAFASRSFLMAADTDAARTFARYTDGLLKYKILCWDALDALPIG